MAFALNRIYMNRMKFTLLTAVVAALSLMIGCARAERIVEVESVTLSPLVVQLNVGESFQLTATILPTDATDQSLTWSSDRHRIAGVSPTGELLGLSAGQTLIRAVSTNGIEAECTVLVAEAAQ